MLIVDLLLEALEKYRDMVSGVIDVLRAVEADVTEYLVGERQWK